MPTALDAPVTDADVDRLFRIVLRRPVGDAEFARRVAASGATVGDYLEQLRNCAEFRALMHDGTRVALDGRRDPLYFRVPQDLVVREPGIGRVLMVGSCLLEIWLARLAASDVVCTADLYMVAAPLPQMPAYPIAAYDFQLVQLPLRAVVPDAAFTRLGQLDLAGHEALFADALERMRRLFDDAMRWNRDHRLLTFVVPFLQPVQNMVGRLMPRFDLRNPVHFVEKLNEALAQEMERYEQAYYVDFNEVIATFGRRLISEDVIAQFNHGAFVGDFDHAHDSGRIELYRPPSERFEMRVQPAMVAAWHELVAMYRTVRRVDAVKLVVVDLDDTLWRGTIAETAPGDMPTSEGWPVGLWEALAVLKRRGVLLGIISSNEEARVREVWPHILHGRLQLEDFAVHRIDWRGKAERMAEILADTALLPEHVVFIDDNPVQRAEVAAAFPAMRVLGGEPYAWRHILLWSAETQVAQFTEEAAARTQMVQAQVRREATRQTQPRGAFLASLDLRMTMARIDAAGGGRFARALELINKTNQFNTTGERWTEAACGEAMRGGLRLHAFEAADRHTGYGLVGVLLVDGAGIRQMVMSCRVMGLELEVAAIGRIIRAFQGRGQAVIQARFVETERNLPCRDLFARCGFTATAGGWERATSIPLPKPRHITIATEPVGAAAPG